MSQAKDIGLEQAEPAAGGEQRKGQERQGSQDHAEGISRAADAAFGIKVGHVRSFWSGTREARDRAIVAPDGQ